MSNYYWRLIIRLLLIFVVMATMAWILPDSRLFFSKIILGLFLLLQIAELIRFLRKSHTYLRQLVDGLNHHDFTQSFPRKSWGRPFDELFRSMENILQNLRAQALEQESRMQYLSMAFSTMDTGLISIEDGKKVVLINERGKEILGVSGLEDIGILKRLKPEFARSIESVKNGGHVVVRMRQGSEDADLSLNAVALTMGNHHYLQVTFRDIRQALDTREIEAWNKLTRILTHEIMNSVTPISSLSETMEAQLGTRTTHIDGETVKDLQYGLGTIRRRSDNLLDFVENYRKLSRMAQPSVAEINLSDIATDIRKLFSSELERSGVEISFKMDESLLHADRGMVEQMLINLIRNSLSALEKTDNPELRIRCQPVGSWTVIAVEDNGHGIGPAEMKEIFVPFFTTRKDGSGIGLSLTRQMMLLHGGKITANSEPGRGTSMQLWFPANPEIA